MSPAESVPIVDQTVAVPLLLFILDETRYALHLPVVERVLPLVEIVPLPGAPAIVVGLINCQGTLLPVVDIRRRFGLPERPLRLNDQLIVAQTTWRKVALLVDTTVNVIEVEPDEAVGVAEILNGIEHIEGVLMMGSGLILVHDLTSLLSLEEESTLATAMGEP